MNVNLYAPLSPESIFGQWAIVNRVRGIWCLPWFLREGSGYCFALRASSARKLIHSSDLVGSRMSK